MFEVGDFARVIDDSGRRHKGRYVKILKSPKREKLVKVEFLDRLETEWFLTESLEGVTREEVEVGLVIDA
jgi:hypothetical protein